MSQVLYDSIYQGQENMCNWCGCDNITFIGCSYLDKHPHHFIYECDNCHKHSWFHCWWSQCYPVGTGEFGEIFRGQ